MIEKEFTCYEKLPKECFTKDGFFDIEPLLIGFKDYPFIFVYGGRGYGKTYSTLKYLHDKRHIFIRRTEDEIKTLCDMDKCDDMSASESPWRPLNQDFGWCIKADKIANGRYAFKTFQDWNHEDDDTGILKANIVALSQVGKVKGAGYENVEYIFYDEFIPMIGTRDTKNDGYHLQQIYETVARNREHITGIPTKLICCANASTIANPVFLEFGLVNHAMKQVIEDQEILLLPDRGVMVVKLPNKSSFVNSKKNTALYKAIPKTSRMYRSSIENEFTEDDWSDVSEKFDKKGMRPYYIIVDRHNTPFTLYEYKGTWRMEQGLDGKASKNVPIYHLMKDSEAVLCMRELLADTWFDFVAGGFSFETYEAKVLYHEILNKKMGANK